MSTTLTLHENTQGAWHVLCAVGRLDTLTAPEGEKTALAALAAHEKLALDLTGLDYLSSAGLRTLLRLAKQAKKDGKQFAITGAAGIVKEVLENSGLDMLLTMYDALSELP